MVQQALCCSTPVGMLVSFLPRAKGKRSQFWAQARVHFLINLLHRLIRYYFSTRTATHRTGCDFGSSISVHVLCRAILFSFFSAVTALHTRSSGKHAYATKSMSPHLVHLCLVRHSTRL